MVSFWPLADLGRPQADRGEAVHRSSSHRHRTVPDGTLPAVARLTIRIDLTNRGAIGPGKIKLLELLGESGSISAAGRAMGMSYRRAWTLIDGLNRSFKSPVVTTQPGGARGGGAVLTDLGHDVIARYRAVERAATKASASDLAALDAERASRPPSGRRSRSAAGTPRRSPLMPRRARR